MLGGGWWFASAWEVSPVLAVGWVVWVIGSIILHELAHGWAAIRQGDDTPIHTGHMTWNPLVHMGPTSLIVFALIGIAWGMMPVNPSRFRSRYGDAIVAFAGPLMNISLAAVAAVLYVVWVGLGGGYWTPWSATDPLFSNLQMFLRVGIMLNLLLAIFNLLPVPPLDGSRILASVHPPFRRLWEGEHAAVLGLIVFAGIFFLGGPYIFGVARELTNALLDVLIGVFVPRAV
jgi:Zn-dependent protease